MGADILIVSDVSFPLQPRERLDSPLSISNQMLAILVRKDSDRQKETLGSQDILIEPALGTTPPTDFTRRGSTIAQGEAAARAVEARLAALRVGEGAYRAYVARRAVRQPGLPLIRFVRVDPESKRYEKTILAEMQPLDRQAARSGRGRRAHHRAVRPGLFRDPRLHAGASKGRGADKQYGLEVRARRKSWGPNYVRFGLNLQDNFQGNSQYNARGRVPDDRDQRSRGGARNQTCRSAAIRRSPASSISRSMPCGSGSSHRARASRRAICRSS